jgi:hypothetical protein
MDIALSGHREGGFHVCRKFHLTEGVCAMASQKPYKGFRKQAASFLEGQLASLPPLLVIIRDIMDPVPKANRLMLNDLRGILMLGTAVENLFYYAGHLIELASISVKCGFSSAFGYVDVIVHIINALNSLLPKIASHLVFSESFYAFAHFRRGSILFIKDVMARHAESVSLFLRPRNIDQFALRPHSINASSKRIINKVSFSPAKPRPSLLMRRVLQRYNQHAANNFMARGEFPHFRKILPREWPRGLHYEFLESTEYMGVELHAEGEYSLPIFVVRRLSDLVRTRLKLKISFDRTWQGGLGRLIIGFPKSTPPSLISQAMTSFIQVSFPLVNSFIDEF